MLLNYTSGTTGFSKGVMITGNNLAGNVTFGIRTELLKKGEKVLSFLPLAHAYGCAFDFLTATAVGTHVTLLGKTPSPKILMKAFEEVKPNLIITVPLVIEKIYKVTCVPTAVAVRKSKAHPYAWAKGRKESTFSPFFKSSVRIPKVTFPARLLPVIITPLLNPVVPEV